MNAVAQPIATSYTPENLVRAVLSCPLESDRRALLAAHLPAAPAEMVAQWVDAFKEHVLETVYTDVDEAQKGADAILTIAELTGNPHYQAIGLRAHGHVLLLGRGESSLAMAPYDEALAIHRRLGDEVGEAQVQGTRIWALASTGRTAEALQDGKDACRILEAHAQWLTLATVLNNLSAIYNRANQFQEALQMVQKAGAAYRQLGAESSRYLPSNALTEALILYNLGRLEEALAVNERAIHLAKEGGQTKVVAQAQSNMAQVQFSRGNYTVALTLFDRAIRHFRADGRPRDAFLTELAEVDCLLELRRFSQVLAKCRDLRGWFAEAGVVLEAAQTVYNEGLAFQGLRRYDEAVASFADASGRFQQENNLLWSAIARLATGRVLLAQGKFQECRQTAQECAAGLDEIGAVMEAAGARLLAAEAAIHLAQYQQAAELIEAVEDQTGREDVPMLNHHVQRLRGMLAQATGRLQAAIEAYERAITALERLQGRLMLEYRADFVGDKQAIYEQIVHLHIGMDRPEAGLAFAERAKSRVLQDMLAHRLDLQIEARSQDDQNLVDRLNALRQERDRLYRRMSAQASTDDHEDRIHLQQAILRREQDITDIWHTLQIRNADYAREAALWQVQVEPVQPFLDDRTLLLEYFTIGDELVLFLVAQDEVSVCRLPAGLDTVQQCWQRLALNFNTVPRSPAGFLSGLAANAQAILQQLFTCLLGPCWETIRAFPRLIIVPHGPLHYLPFHALYNDSQYLLESHQISYLPGASFLRFAAEPAVPVKQGLMVGHSYQGRLPYAPAEAQQVAAFHPGTVLLEEAATRPEVTNHMREAQLLHLATHAEFRADNPLFSGLALADGWLTTLDIFNLHLKAALVTLSACQTGRSVVGGGDELLGLMRAFLSAGAASLVLSLWVVEDQSTATVMQHFYRHLSAGRGKAAALQAAQRHLLTHPDYAHPYFWAPFYLVGHTGPLT